MLRKKIVSLLLVFAIMLSIIAVPVEALATAAGPKVITILYTNDVHGNAVEDDKAGKLGFAKLKTFVDSKPGALLLDAGDMTHGTTFATISSGLSIIDLMNKIGYDAMTPGNHDYNYGKEGLAKLANEADFPILQANIVDASGARPLPANKMLEVNGVKVGIFGIVTPETKTKSNPINTVGLTFTDYIGTAQSQVAELKAQGAEAIIALVHLGLDESSVERSDVLAQRVPGIDVIIDGHSHTLIDQPKLLNGVLIAQTGDHLKNVGEVTLTIENGKVNSKTSRLHTYAELKGLAPNAEILSAIAAVEESNKPYLEQVVGRTDVLLEGTRELVRAGETNLGNLLTDSMLAISGADVALTNGGGIRSSIDVGDITMGEILQAFPFTNYPVVLELKGSEILEALEFGVDSAPEVVGKFPHVGGMTFKYDPKQAAGARVFDVKVKGVDLDPAKTYKLVTNDFMAVGGDGYEMLKKGKKVSEHPLLSEVLAIYISEKGTVSPKVEGRITVASKPVKYTDITGHWASKYILEMSDLNVFYGVGDNLFAPDAQISRGMILTALHRMDGNVEPKTVANFTDVERGSWYDKAISWAVENNIARPATGTFKPNEILTREEMVTILSNFLTYKKTPIREIKPADFADEAQIAEWAQDAVDRTVTAGIIHGKPDNMFDPKGGTTRAELAKVLYMLRELKISSTYELLVA